MVLAGRLPSHLHRLLGEGAGTRVTSTVSWERVQVPVLRVLYALSSVSVGEMCMFAEMRKFR
jgi:hypothetical protein